MIMWWKVVLQVTCFLTVGGVQLMHDPVLAASTGINCIDFTNKRFSRMFNEDWRSQKPFIRKMITKRSLSGHFPARFTVNMQPMSRRMDAFNIIDNLIPRGDYLVKEHAKLVHDINSLRQVVFITPFAEENKDYDDSIFHEIIETSTTAAPAPSTSRPFVSTTRASTAPTKGSSIPIILLGGASQRQLVKSQPINFAKPTVSLVGTTISPVVKHPYPFVVHRKPVKICVTNLPPMPMPTAHPTTKTLWERLIDYFIPRRSLGR